MLSCVACRTSDTYLCDFDDESTVSKNMESDDEVSYDETDLDEFSLVLWMPSCRKELI